MDELDVHQAQLELKKEIEGYLPEFLTAASPGNEERVAKLLRAHDFILITGLNARFSGVQEIDFKWNMVKFYYGITVFDPDLPYLCDLNNPTPEVLKG